MNRLRVASGVLLFGMLLDGALGAEIRGKVSEASGDVVKIVAQGEELPRVGDKVDLIYRIPGLDDVAEIGSGSVTEVRPDYIVAKIDRPKGKLAAGQEARITSEHPQKRSELGPAPGPAAKPKNPAKPPPEPTPAPKPKPKPKPTPKPPVAAVPHANGPPVLADDFAERAPRRVFAVFAPKSSAFDHTDTQGGRLTGSGNRTGVLPAIYRKQNLRDLAAEFDLTVPSPRPNNGYGLVFRSDDVLRAAPRYYAFQIQPSRSIVGLDAWKEPHWALTLRKRFEPRLFKAGQSNHLRLEAFGSRLRVFLNGTLILDTADESIPEAGTFGPCLVMADKQPDTAYFQNLRVYRLTNPLVALSLKSIE